MTKQVYIVTLLFPAMHNDLWCCTIVAWFTVWFNV